MSGTVITVRNNWKSN